MGAEAAVLIGAIGPEKLPRNWANRVSKTDSELAAFVADDAEPDWLRNSVEAYIALTEVTREIRERIAARVLS